MSRFVFCNGMYRSGSTLVYNIARELMEAEFGPIPKTEALPHAIREKYTEFESSDPRPAVLIKKHYYVPRGGTMRKMKEARFLFTYRNPLDIAASAQKRCLAKTGEYGEYVPDGWDRYEEDYFDQLDWSQALMIRYEKMVESTVETVKTICDIANFLRLPVSAVDASRIASTYSARTLKNMTDKMESDFMDKRTFLQDFHISKDLGKPDTWREHLSATTIKACVEQCGRMMRHAGYEIPDI